MQSINIRVQTLAEAAAGRSLFPEFNGQIRDESKVIGVGILESGTMNGQAVVGILVDDTTGRKSFVQFTANIFHSIDAALRGAEARFAIGRGGRG
ncbi:MAG: hypothetical protein IT581_06540 [Verrucomicrobiales bacterium]|nr:hypothetical protein [Verrucomicrobiales bacterium]